MRSPARDAIWNMALDEAMLRDAARHQSVSIRLYRWDRPSVSFGRNQRCAGIYTSERCDAAGVPAVRRLTGGRALLHGAELTYCVAAPTSRAPTLRGGYEAINTLLISALALLGVRAVRAHPDRRTPSPGLAPCFEVPSAGELVVDGRKLVGSAQHREADAFLQHGSILLDDDQGLLADLAVVPLPHVPPPATLRGILAGISFEHVADAIQHTLGNCQDGQLVHSPDTDLDESDVDAALTRYRDPRWTWRR
jgi:lipoyl(octanoyl) transferase